MRSGRRVEPVAGAAAGSSSTIWCRAVFVQAHQRRRRARIFYRETYDAKSGSARIYARREAVFSELPKFAKRYAELLETCFYRFCKN